MPPQSFLWGVHNELWWPEWSRREVKGTHQLGNAGNWPQELTCERLNIRGWLLKHLKPINDLKHRKMASQHTSHVHVDTSKFITKLRRIFEKMPERW